MYKYLFVIWLMAGCAFAATAQKADTTSSKIIKSKAKDTLVSTKHDTVNARSFAPKIKKEKRYHPDSTHSPHTALMRSLIIPGRGQAYNHQWWKVPLIYAGLGALAYYIVFNDTSYSTYLALSKFREHGTAPGPTNRVYHLYNALAAAGVPSQAIYDASDYYRRNRDLCILGVFLLWGTNVIDAYVAAKFMNVYSIDDNLSMRVTPGLINQTSYAELFTGPYIPGIKITFTLK